MGKRLIIKDADFSANAVYAAVDWSIMACVKPWVIPNPSNASFGQSGSDSSASYPITVRAYSTISVPAGKKIIVEVEDKATSTRQRILPNALYYSGAWEGSGSGFKVPASAFPATSILFNQQSNIYSRFEWVNNTGSAVNFMLEFGLDGTPSITGSNYNMRYAIVDE